MDKLVDKENLPKNQNEENLLPYFELFEYLPLYYSHIIKNKENIDTYISDTKVQIIDKIKKFLEENSNEDNAIKMNEIRVKIDEEIDKVFFEEYNDLIPFKFFYIKKIYINNAPKGFLKCHFPLIKEIWNEIIYTKTLSLFDREIKYTGSINDSLLKLNFVNQCKSGNFSLDIDCIVEIDSLYNMGKITFSNCSELEKKNILLIQKNENTSSFDVGFLKAKNTEEPSMSYIQIKKSLTDNKVNKAKTYDAFQHNITNFYRLFKVKPKSCYLIYITLFNKSINNNIILFENLRQDKQKNKNKNKEKQMDSETIDSIKKINELDEFCRNNEIILIHVNQIFTGEMGLISLNQN